jgi:biotin synthase
MTTWNTTTIDALFDKPLMDLLYQAASVHRENFDQNAVQVSTLLSVKTGNCPEDCSYCSQSVRHRTGLEPEKTIDTSKVVAAAKKAKANGSSRFCMGFAWRSPPKKSEFAKVIEMIDGVKNLGMETCLSMGMLSKDQCQELKEAGLDYVNHNIDTSERYYKEIISTRKYQDRLDTLSNVAQSGLKVCCGGIMDMGETRQDRVDFFLTLLNLEKQPESIPLNRLMPVKGTPLGDIKQEDDLMFLRCIAIARVLFPKSMVRLSAGRSKMSDTMQTLCFFAGANSIFYGEKLLTCENPSTEKDDRLFEKLGMMTMPLKNNSDNKHDTQTTSCQAE